MLIVALDIGVDAMDQVAHGSKATTPDALAADHAEPDFDLVEPGRIGWGVMKLHSGMGFEPGLDALGLMRRKVIGE